MDCTRLGFWTALVGAAATALAGCRARPPAVPVSLVDVLDGAAVEGLPSRVPAWVSGQRASVGSERARRAGELFVLRLGPDARWSSERTALVAVSGATYRIPIELPLDARLDFAVGAYAAGKARSGGLNFSIRVAPAGGQGPTIAWRERLGDDRLQAWWDRSVDLSSLGGRRVEIELATDGDPAYRGGWATPVVVPAAAHVPRPDILLVSIDTLRADHLGAWGYARPTSPDLDRFAARSFRFAQAISQAPWTRPSHRAMLSGDCPVSRGGFEPHPISETLRRAGYETLAFTGGGQVDARFGFDDGFERYDGDDWIRHPGRLAARLAERRGRPIFAFLHTYEVHDPYDDARFAGAPVSAVASPGFSLGRLNSLGRKRLTEADERYIEALYDGDIAFTDAQVGKLLAALERSGVARRAIVVVTSDHGEQFWEHGHWRHGTSLYDHDVHVPLIVHVPSEVRREIGARTGRELVAAGVVGDEVRSIDIVPTLLDLVGLAPVAPVQGRSLVPWLEGRSMPPVESLSESIEDRPYEQKALRTARYKLIRLYPKRSPEASMTDDLLFDLRADPGELHNLAAASRGAVEALAGRLAALTAGGSGSYEREVPAKADAALRRQLEAPGYLGGDSADAEPPSPPR